MPQLKQLSCSVQWPETGTAFQEYGTVYGDGVVETYIAIPNNPQSFNIRLTSRNYIYEGLAAVVFIDGNYHSNRNRTNLVSMGATQDTDRNHVDFVIRQKEKPVGNGMYIGRDWRFDDHNLVLETPAGIKEEHFQSLGTIEVLVLRCQKQSKEDAPLSSRSSAADSDIFADHDRLEQPHVDNQPDTEAAQESDQGSEIGGFFGIFDGAGDLPDRYGFTSGHPHMSYGSTQLPNRSRHQRHSSSSFSSQGSLPQHRPSQQSQHYFPQQGAPYPPQTSQQPNRRRERHVHFDFGQAGPPPHLHRTREDPIGPRPASYDRYRPASSYLDGSNTNRATVRPPNSDPFGSSAHASNADQAYHSSQSAQGSGLNQHPNSQQPPSFHLLPPPLHPYYAANHVPLAAPGPGLQSKGYNNIPTYPATYIAPPSSYCYPNSVAYWPVPAPNSAASDTANRTPGNIGPHGLGINSVSFNASNRHSMYNTTSHGDIPPLPPPPPPLSSSDTFEKVGASTSNCDHRHHDCPVSANGNAGSPHTSYKIDQTARSHRCEPSDNRADNHNCPNCRNLDFDVATENGSNGQTPGALMSGDDGLNGESNGDTRGTTDWGNNTWQETNTHVQATNNDSDDWNNDKPGNGSSGNNNSVRGNWDTDQNTSKDQFAVNSVTNWSAGAKGSINKRTANRPLFGPHGQYYTWKPSGPDEPTADAEEEPRYDVPRSIAQLRGTTKQVQPGKGYLYCKKRCHPRYIDTVEEPYARFVFKYRTREQLKKEIGIDVETEPSGNEIVQTWQNMDKNALIEMLGRAQSALGGKLPSPPMKSTQDAAETGPAAVDAPIQTFLKYSIPPARVVAAVSRSSGARDQTANWGSASDVRSIGRNSTRSNRSSSMGKKSWSDHGAQPGNNHSQESDPDQMTTGINNKNSNPPAVGEEQTDWSNATDACHIRDRYSPTAMTRDRRRQQEQSWNEQAQQTSFIPNSTVEPQVEGTKTSQEWLSGPPEIDPFANIGSTSSSPVGDAIHNETWKGLPSTQSW